MKVVFYPKITTYCMHFWTVIFTESMLMMYNSVTHDDLWSEIGYTTRTTTIRVTVKFSLVNTPKRLVMIYLTGRYQRFGPKQLLRLSGIIFVNSDKIQLWQHKVAPYKSKFWVLFGSLGFQKWSRKVCRAL